jgi:hypothetical protein
MDGAQMFFPLVAKSERDLGRLGATAASYSRTGAGICAVVAPTNKKMMPGTLNRSLLSVVLTCMLLGVAAGSSRAQEAQSQPASEAANAEALRKAAQNPVASLISVPFQDNWNFNIGSADRVQNVLNIQPVIPTTLSKNWNLIIRWITPVIYQPVAVPVGDGSTFQQTGYYGLGDMQPQFFISPRKKSKLIWGVGPQLLLPTATKTGVLGQGKFGLGPTVVVLAQPGKWTVGALANNVWSVAGHSNLPDVNQFVLQYFINYNMPKGWYLASQPVLTANWNAPSGSQWVVPFGGGIGRIMKLGSQPVNLQAQFFGNAVHPPGASPWSMRVQIVLLFPKK